MTAEDRLRARDHYDELGAAEWDRLEATPRARVSLEVHRRFLSRFVGPGMRVLEIGAGPGRFTQELLARGARVVVSDYSSVQLDLNRERTSVSPNSSRVESYKIVDVCDTSEFSAGEFDAVVAFGGPLSYVFEEIDPALSGLFRITGPSGIVVASVMSSLGTWRYFLPGYLQDAEGASEEAHDQAVETGDLRPLGSPHVCQMFRSREMSALIARNGGEVLAMSASNWASLGDVDALGEIESDGSRWARFLDHEAAACAEPGALDGGTHLLFAARARA